MFFPTDLPRLDCATVLTLLRSTSTAKPAKSDANDVPEADKAGHLENFDSLPVGQRVCQDQVGVDIEGIRTEKDGFREFFRLPGEINIPQ